MLRFLFAHPHLEAGPPASCHSLVTNCSYGSYGSTSICSASLPILYLHFAVHVVSSVPHALVQSLSCATHSFGSMGFVFMQVSRDFPHPATHAWSFSWQLCWQVGGGGGAAVRVRGSSAHKYGSERPGSELG